MMIATDTGSRKSHVAEDIYDIPEEMYSPEVLLTPTSGPQRVLPRIYQARDASREQGRRPVELLETGDIELLSAQARKETFDDVRNNDKAAAAAAAASASSPSPATTWDGPPAKIMAEAGFCRGLNRTARCVYCTVTIRNWTPTDDPWKRHKCFSPCCKRLLQVWDAGIHPSPQGRRRLRHSCSSLADLKSHRAA
ncbi:uncharacterized protein [Littorina saxatilis]